MQIYICINSIILIMKLTTRLIILDHIRKNQVTSAGELSRLLGVTGSNVRHHLAILEANVLVEVVGQRKEGRGRPTYVYGLSRRMLGDGLDKLASSLLSTMLSKTDETNQKNILTAVAVRMAGNDIRSPLKSISQQLTHVIDWLNDLHYQARWEASSRGPKIILGHCPYAAILGDHPELCKLDAYLLEARITLPVTQIDKLQPTVKGLPFCAFQLQRS